MTLDVEAARAELLRSLPPRDPKWRIWVDGVVERLADRCEVEDPRLQAVVEAERRLVWDLADASWDELYNFAVAVRKALGR